MIWSNCGFSNWSWRNRT